MRRVEKAERRARRGHAERDDRDGLRSMSRDRSSRSRSPVRREKGGEREYRSRRPRSWSRTPPRRGDYRSGEWDRDRRRWDESSRR